MISRTAAGPRVYPRTASLSHTERLARLERLARFMDAAIAIPGTRISLGADAVVGLVPGVGDLVAKIASAYILYEAHQMGIPKHKLVRMGGNVLLDLVFGSVPIAGDVFDVFWRANLRNMKIVRDHVAKAK
ncbi:hypothetical protein IZ6_01250 [Terrihabitans soli]|uniref:DUF4112 domain-containing protein n=1 Tax=Terrihabitans soli TaxID=708113 RepID=A0A6S6QR81_9HYPH|nr:DUF4112 domain-containing protein [Terrihabitans soli]BCJ89390.1 hypothetical protein IZ6_01250 [Terrihabitans soli]